MEKAILGALVIFLLVFPKGGIRAGGIPLTWGYVALGLLSLSFPLALWRGLPWKVSPLRLLTVGLLLPFQLVVLAGLLVNGYEHPGFAVSLFVTFFLIPLAQVLLLGIHLDRIDTGFLLRLVRWGVLLVAVYGIFLFAYKLATGRFIEIPLLTVNAGDLGTLETTKNIDRGGIFKLISTYNNGNIYGISLLMLLPLYALMERSWVRTGLVKFSLLLTLSRTVWAGLLFYEVVQRLFVKRLSLRGVAVFLTSLVMLVAGVLYTLDFMRVDVGFLFDPRLGGRIRQWGVLETATLLPRASFDGILEIVYLSILDTFGVLGLVTFLVAMTAPILLWAAGAISSGATAYKRALVAGQLLYLFVATSDGAILYIPVMAIYWFLVSLLLSSGASAAPAVAASGG
ncbi:hypothetical protein BH20GEM2_BH20GEM2_09960 [soil metagenome]